MSQRFRQGRLDREISYYRGQWRKLPAADLEVGLNTLYQCSAREIVSLLSNEKVSIAEVLDALRVRLDEVNPLVNALPTVCFERAYEQARQLQALPVHERGVLCGLPVNIKDLTPVEGVRTTFGSAIYADHIPDVSDQLVTRIEQRGGVIYAKSNTPEFGAGGITFNNVFGPTATPHDLKCASGGSSGGAAASLASGCAWLSHGSDMAGSLRTPAAFCGVSSLRPSPGTIRSDSLYLPFDVLGADGPMARDIQDLALFADVMRNAGGTTMRQAALQPRRAKRVAVSCDLGIAKIDNALRAEFNALLDQLSDAGYELIDNAPDLSGLHESFDVLRAQVFAVALERELQEHPGVMKEDLEWNIRHGLELNAKQIRSALRKQGELVHQAAQFMLDFDLLLCPATSVVSAPVSERYVGFAQGVAVAEYYRWLSIAYAATMMALPVITLPVVLPCSGRSGAVQLIGKPWGEEHLFSIARELEVHIGRDPSPIDPVQ